MEPRIILLAKLNLVTNKVPVSDTIKLRKGIVSHRIYDYMLILEDKSPDYWKYREPIDKKYFQVLPLSNGTYYIMSKTKGKIYGGNKEIDKFNQSLINPKYIDINHYKIDYNWYINQCLGIKEKEIVKTKKNNTESLWK